MRRWRISADSVFQYPSRLVGFKIFDLKKNKNKNKTLQISNQNDNNNTVLSFSSRTRHNSLRTAFPSLPFIYIPKLENNNNETKKNSFYDFFRQEEEEMDLEEERHENENNKTKHKKKENKNNNNADNWNVYSSTGPLSVSLVIHHYHKNNNKNYNYNLFLNSITSSVFDNAKHNKNNNNIIHYKMIRKLLNNNHPNNNTTLINDLLKLNISAEETIHNNNNNNNSFSVVNNVSAFVAVGDTPQNKNNNNNNNNNNKNNNNNFMNRYHCVMIPVTAELCVLPYYYYNFQNNNNNHNFIKIWRDGCWKREEEVQLKECLTYYINNNNNNNGFFLPLIIEDHRAGGSKATYLNSFLSDFENNNIILNIQLQRQWAVTDMVSFHQSQTITIKNENNNNKKYDPYALFFKIFTVNYNAVSGYPLGLGSGVIDTKLYKHLSSRLKNNKNENKKIKNNNNENNPFYYAYSSGRNCWFPAEKILFSEHKTKTENHHRKYILQTIPPPLVEANSLLLTDKNNNNNEKIENDKNMFLASVTEKIYFCGFFLSFIPNWFKNCFKNENETIKFILHFDDGFSSLKELINNNNNNNSYFYVFQYDFFSLKFVWKKHKTENTKINFLYSLKNENLNHKNNILNFILENLHLFFIDVKIAFSMLSSLNNNNNNELFNLFQKKENHINNIENHNFNMNAHSIALVHQFINITHEEKYFTPENFIFENNNNEKDTIETIVQEEESVIPIEDENNNNNNNIEHENSDVLLQQREAENKKFMEDFEIRFYNDENNFNFINENENNSSNSFFELEEEMTKIKNFGRRQNSFLPQKSILLDETKKQIFDASIERKNEKSGNYESFSEIKENEMNKNENYTFFDLIHIEKKRSHERFQKWKRFFYNNNNNEEIKNESTLLSFYGAHSTGEQYLVMPETEEDFLCSEHKNQNSEKNIKILTFDIGLSILTVEEEHQYVNATFLDFME